MKKYLLPFALFACFAVGLLAPLPQAPVARVEVDQPAVVMECLDGSLEWCAPEWQKEIARRFPHAAAILVHGGDFVQGEWVASTSYEPHRHVTPIPEIIEKYRRHHPTRTLVLLACNTGSVTLKGYPNVYYFKGSVWCLPDRSLRPEHFENEIAKRTFNGLGWPNWEDFGDEKKKEHQPTRWEMRPNTNGNIFEAIEAR